MEPTSSVLTIDDLSIYLKIPKSTLYKLAQKNKLPGQKVGKHWRFRKVVIDDWLSNNDSANIIGRGVDES